MRKTWWVIFVGVTALIAAALALLAASSCKASGRVSELDTARIKAALSELRRLEQVRAFTDAQITAQEQPHLDHLKELCKANNLDPAALYQGKVALEDDGTVRGVSPEPKASPVPVPKKP